MKNLLWKIYQWVNSFVFGIPVMIIRCKYASFVLCKMGKSNTIGIHLRIMGGGRISLGNDIVINRNVVLDGRKGLEIQDSVDIGEYSSIWSLQHDPNNINHECIGSKTIIEDHVWIAPHSIILPGVKICKGAVVATGSVVTRDVPELAIVAGVPAKQIGIRKNPLTYKLHKK